MEALEHVVDAEDKVVRARHPKRAIGLEDAPSRLQSPDVSLEALPKPIGRIESLRPILRFRVFLGGDGANELEVVR